MKCKCKVEETTGWTTVKCCNICGLPIQSEQWNFRIEPISILPDLLIECHKLIQQGIYSEDGIDGGEGQELLDKIEQHVKVERSHRDITGLIET